ncbi:hypothetical protein L9F63_009538 [Diploptera punctata]|uniref:Wiskott-Aldrich syndrome protein family member n=1 Tax=Diploptera punctata TaxID=6984 RepID=A0AAD8ALZ5_DIPPU|nr:hypothetical protein L9F63_009538 [Diploptera punctata]
MPFVQRVVEPKYLSRRSLHGEDGQPLVTDYELEAVTNNTLCSALRQLASLMLIANDIFEDLAKQLQDFCERSEKLQSRVEVVEGKVVAFDPKKVTVRKYSILIRNFKLARVPNNNKLCSVFHHLYFAFSHFLYHFSTFLSTLSDHLPFCVSLSRSLPSCFEI